jgi:hypothetical protein
MMNGAFVFFVSVLLLTSICFAQDIGKIAEALNLQIQIPVTNIPEDLWVDMYIVSGSNLDLVERTILDSITSDSFSMESQVKVVDGGRNITTEVKINKKLLSDNETTLEELKGGISVIILVGSQSRNRITEEVYDKGYITNESTPYIGQLTIGKGQIDSDSNVMVIYHKTAGEGKKLEREAVKYSPLRGFMPDEYVPVAATAIGMFLLSFFNIFKTVAEFLALDIGRKKKKFGHTGPKIMGINLKEAAAVFGAAMVLGFAVTWTFAGPTAGFFNLLLLNALICLFAALSHELSHRLIGRLFGIKIEYRFWPMGSFVTVVTAFLGNSFGIQGFLMEKVDEDISRWKYAVTKLSAPVISTTITVIFAYVYIGNPQVIFQMIYTTASIWAMAEIMPVKGLDGYDIKRWSKLVWFVFFAIISIIFFSVNFIQ